MAYSWQDLTKCLVYRRNIIKHGPSCQLIFIERSLPDAGLSVLHTLSYLRLTTSCNWIYYYPQPLQRRGGFQKGEVTSFKVTYVIKRAEPVLKPSAHEFAYRASKSYNELMNKYSQEHQYFLTASNSDGWAYYILIFADFESAQH